MQNPHRLRGGGSFIWGLFFKVSQPLVNDALAHFTFYSVYLYDKYLLGYV